MSIETGNHNNNPNFDDTASMIIESIIDAQLEHDACNDEFDRISLAASASKDLNMKMLGEKVRASFSADAVGVQFEGDNRIGMMAYPDGTQVTVVGDIDFINYGLIAEQKGYVLHLKNVDTGAIVDSDDPDAPIVATLYVPIALVRTYEYASTDKQ